MKIKKSHQLIFNYFNNIISQKNLKIIHLFQTTKYELVESDDIFLLNYLLFKVFYKTNFLQFKLNTNSPTIHD